MPGPLTIVTVVVLVGLAGVVVAFWSLSFFDRNGDLTRMVQAFFRRGPRAPQAPPADHYYTPFWLKR